MFYIDNHVSLDFVFSFPVSMPFLSFSCLRWLVPFMQMLTRSCRGSECLIPDFNINTSNVNIISIMFTLFSKGILYQIKDYFSVIVLCISTEIYQFIFSASTDMIRCFPFLNHLKELKLD